MVEHIIQRQVNMQNAEKLIASSAIKFIREEIAGAGGNEVFFAGASPVEGLVQSARVAARGNEVSAPAIMQAASWGEVVIHNHPSGELTPSQADISTASALGNCGVGFYIVDNEVTSVYVVVEAFKEPSVESLDCSELISLIEPGGPISKKLRGFEFRLQQGKMLEAVVRAFNDDGIALLEAGTGTGKTMAYLIPAIHWAKQNGERVVVSTQTITLQEQLVHKDIPFLQKALGLKFRAVQVLGRGNYVCLRKAGQLRMEPELLVVPEELGVLADLLKWIDDTSTGCRTELGFVPSQTLWEKLCSESDYCMGSRCAEHKRCFVNSARREAAAADLMVVNHYLLFADMALRRLKGVYSELAILPWYKRLIIDEAHTIEDVATSYFGTQITRLGLARMLGRLYSPAGSGKGLLPYLLAALRKSEGKDPTNIMKILEHELIPSVSETVNYSNTAFDAILKEATRYSGQGYPERKLRMTPEVVKSREWSKLLETDVAELTDRLKDLAKELYEASKKIERHAGETLADQCFELRVNSDRLEAVADDLRRVLSGGETEEVDWVEGRSGNRGANIVRVLSSPLNMANDLAENLFERIPTIVLTSATLTVENRFQYLKTRLGLASGKGSVAEERVEEMLLHSPFDFQRQVVIGIPMDIPEPGDEEFDESSIDVIYRILETTGGKAFVLFTSYRPLDKVYGQLKEPLRALGINTLKQGEKPRHQLLQSFKRDKTSVLFATDSFWQGVDVEGEALECVILVKLPFRVPTEPVLEARYQLIEEQGGNAFLEYIVPQAVIKFKQGFGRLIRKSTDRGAVLILDRRIAEKFYGRLFMKSLPPCNTVAGNVEEVLEAIGKFFENQG